MSVGRESHGRVVGNVPDLAASVVVIPALGALLEGWGGFATSLAYAFIGIISARQYRKLHTAFGSLGRIGTSLAEACDGTISSRQH